MSDGHLKIWLNAKNHMHMPCNFRMQKNQDQYNKFSLPMSIRWISGWYYVYIKLETCPSDIIKTLHPLVIAKKT